jgi:pimeloyl-ACP methyl ester carboxylesterase
METKMIEVGGIRIAYERAGNGPPLVLLHGYVWGRPDDLAAAAGRALRRLHGDRLGCTGAGRSSDPPESFGMDGYADCLTGFVERLGLDRPHVAGLSFGGALALASAVATPPSRGA